MRGRIAHLAARMIAVDGVRDYGLAKRKAARQVGAPDSRNLPTNLEIEDALRAYQALYQADEHPEQLQQLRRLALEMMRLLEAVQPAPDGTGAFRQRRPPRRDTSPFVHRRCEGAGGVPAESGDPVPHTGNPGLVGRCQLGGAELLDQLDRRRLLRHRAGYATPAPATAHDFRRASAGARDHPIRRISGHGCRPVEAEAQRGASPGFVPSHPSRSQRAACKAK